MMTKSSNGGIAQQISHWIHDEQACVTAQRVLQTFNISWEEASMLLKKIPQEGRKYSVTSFVSSRKRTLSSDDDGDAKDDDDSNVFQLVKSELVRGDDNDNDLSESSSAWYSLALNNSSESIHTSHERDRSQLQEVFVGLVAPPALCGNGDSTGYASSIFVAEKLQERIKNYGGSKRPVEGDDLNSDLMPSKAAFVRPVKKTATSARNFFGASTKTTTTGASGKSKPVPSRDDGKNGTKSKPAKSSVHAFQPKSNDLTDKKNIAAPTNKHKQQKSRDAEKENVLNKSSKAVGNADDFRGDMDDEDYDKDGVEEADDGSRDEKAPTKTVNKEGAYSKPKKIARRAYQMDDSDSVNGDEQPEEEDVGKIAKTNPAANNRAKRPRRRKRLVEKTFLDENGYMLTETQTVWEDVPSDEEEVGVVTNKKSTGVALGKKEKASGPPKALKQGSIMGFFKKK